MRTYFKRVPLALWVVCFFLNCEQGHSDPFLQLYRSSKAQAMGDAVVAIVDDEDSVFYNPAGLANINYFGFHFTNLNAEVSADTMGHLTNYSSILGGNLSAAVINSFLGQNIYTRVEGTSSVLMPGFAISAIYDTQAAIRLTNPYEPTGTVGIQTTYGVQLGYGLDVWKLKKKRGELKIGLAAKMLWRAGGYQSPTLTDILTLNTANIIGTTYKTFSTGYGADAGTQFVYHVHKQLDVMSGFAVTDIGNTNFAAGTSPQLSNITGGLGFRYKTKDVRVTLTYDYKHFFETIDWRLKTHMGLELKLPLVTVFGGLSQLYPCYGASLDISFVKLMYVFYTEELGNAAYLNPERRQLANVLVKFDL